MPAPRSKATPLRRPAAAPLRKPAAAPLRGGAAKPPRTVARLEVRSVPVSSLHPDPVNARRHGERNLEAIAGSLDAFGQIEPLIVQRGTGRIIGGNGRFTVLKQLGHTHVNVVEVDLDDERAAALGLALNRTAELADWDLEHLERVVSGIRDFDLDAIGLSQAELANIMRLPKDTMPGEEDLPELDDSESAESEPGETYELGPHRLVCGDSTDDDVVAQILEGETPHLMIFDPPYDLDYLDWSVPEGTNVVSVWGYGWGPVQFLAARLDPEAFDIHSLIFAGNARGRPVLSRPVCSHDRSIMAIRTKPVKQTLKHKRRVGLQDEVAVAQRKWWKTGTEALDTELARSLGLRVAGDGRPFDIIRDVGVAPIAKGKTWGKTLLCMGCMMVYCPEGSLVYDPCAGGGTSLIAAARYRRVWRGAELDPPGCDFIRRRWTRWATKAKIDPGPGALSEE